MTKIGIYGYGNLGKGVELAIRQNPDMQLSCVFTRRAPEKVQLLTPGVPVYAADDVMAHKGEVDVMILCGGSATDLPGQTPALAAAFNCVDSFDTHARIPEHFANVDAAAKAAGTTAVISAGWDPGMFSLARLYSNCILPEGKDYTFWGVGVSQGHSDAVRRIPGVKNAKQYTVPVQEAMDRIRSGETPDFTTREKHTRLCYVVAEEGADKAAIETAIKTMKNYFDEYDTTVNFIDEETFNREHSAMPHGGHVIRRGVTGADGENSHVIEYSLTLDSNPEFTGSVLVACARAVARMNAEGRTGCATLFDIAPAYLSPMTGEQLRKKML